MSFVAGNIDDELGNRQMDGPGCPPMPPKGAELSPVPRRRISKNYEETLWRVRELSENATLRPSPFVPALMNPKASTAATVTAGDGTGEI